MNWGRGEFEERTRHLRGFGFFPEMIVSLYFSVFKVVFDVNDCSTTTFLRSTMQKKGRGVQLLYHNCSYRHEPDNWLKSNLLWMTSPLRRTSWISRWKTLIFFYRQNFCYAVLSSASLVSIHHASDKMRFLSGN